MRKRKINDDKLLEMLKKDIPQKKIALHFGCSEPAVTKRLKYLRSTRPPESFEKLTDKQKKFVTAIVGGSNQTQAALTSFECSSLDSAKSIGSKLMQEPSMKMAIKDLFSYYGQSRAKRISKLSQHIEHPDPAVSLKSLEMSFKLDKGFSEDDTMKEDPGRHIALLEIRAKQINLIIQRLSNKHPLYEEDAELINTILAESQKIGITDGEK
tara:strand:- start:577 stop:1209 length:633 start_codon:yes stop_codon:yes gene_type:complete